MGVTTRAVASMLTELTVPAAQAVDLKLRTASGTVSGVRVTAPQLGYDTFWYTHERRWFSIATNDPGSHGREWSGLLANASPYTVAAAVIADLWDTAAGRLATASGHEASFYGACVRSCQMFLTNSLQESINGPYAGEAVGYAQTLAAERAGSSPTLAAPTATSARTAPARPTPPAQTTDQGASSAMQAAARRQPSFAARPAPAQVRRRMNPSVFAALMVGVIFAGGFTVALVIAAIV